MADADLLSDDDVGLGSPAPAPSAAPQPTSLLSDEDVGVAPPAGTGVLTNTGDEGYLSGTAKNVATGAIKGAGDAVGFGGNMGGMADYLVDRGEQGVRYLTGNPKPFDQIRADNAAAMARTTELEKQTPLGSVVAATDPRKVLPTGQDISAPILAKTGNYEPDTPFGRLAQTGVETAVGSLGPAGGGVEAGATKGALLGTMAKQAPLTAASGVVGQGVTDATDDPLLGMAAGAGAGALAHGVAAGVNKTIEPFAEKLPVVGGLYTGTQDRLAGQKLLGAAQDPEAFKSALAQQGEYKVLDGFEPTTAQITGDQGIAQAERGDAATFAAPYIQRANDQKLAIKQTLDALTPTGSPEAVTSHLKSQLAAMDNDAEMQIGLSRIAAQDEASKIGTGVGPEVTGDDLRTHVALANQAAAQNARGLWKAVDPDGTLANSMTGIKQAAGSIYGNLTDTAKQFLSPEEVKIAGLVNGYKPVEPFQQLSDLRSNLASAMRQEKVTNGNTPAYARMSGLMDAVQGTINNAVEGRAAQEAHAVQTGAMSPEDTMVARLQADVRQFLSNRTVGLASGAEGAGAYSGRGSAGASRVPGAASQASRGLGSDAGFEGLSQTPLQPNFDEAAAGRVKAATAATKQLHQIYDNGVPGDLLASRGSAGDYKLPNSAVPAKVIKPGPQGYDAIKQYMQAANNSPEAELSLHNAFAEMTRDKAIGPDGMVDPTKLAQVKRNYAHAFRAMDEVTPSFSSGYDKAADATSQVMAHKVARDAMRDDYQQGIIGKLLGADGEDEIVNRFGRMMGADDRMPQINKLIQATKGNPDATAGLQKVAVKWMAKKWASQTEIGATGEKQVGANAYKKVLSDNHDMLTRLFPDDHRATMHMVAQALDMQNRSVTSKLAGSPGTAQDLNRSAMAHGKAPSSIGEAVKSGAMLGYVAHGLHGAAYGAATGAAQHVIRTLRSMGIDNVNKLYTDALLNPQKARDYLATVPAHGQNGLGKSIAASLRRSFLTVPQEVASQPQPVARASGGRLSSDEKPVASITGEEIAPRSASRDQLREAGRAYYEAKLRGTKVFNEDLGKNIEFRSSKKAFSASGDPDKIRAFAALRDVLGKGKVISSKPPYALAVEPSTKAYHTIGAHVTFPDGVRHVRATVREDTSGNLYYDHRVGEAERPQQSRPEDTEDKSGPGRADGGAVPSAKIGENGDDINLSASATKPSRALGGRVAAAPFATYAPRAADEAIAIALAMSGLRY